MGKIAGTNNNPQRSPSPERKSKPPTPAPKKGGSQPAPFYPKRPDPTPKRQPPRFPGAFEVNPKGAHLLPSPSYPKKPRKKETSSEEEEEESEAESEEEESEETKSVVRPTKDFFTVDGLIDELEETVPELVKRYFVIWKAMNRPDKTWQIHLYDLYLEYANKNVDTTISMMRKELAAEAQSQKSGKKTYWRIDSPLPEQLAKASLGTVCITCLEERCNH